MIMATINDKLTYLAGTKDAIKQAIIAKGVAVEDNATFRSYADKIATIQGGGSAALPEGMKFGYSTFTEAPLFDTSNVTDMNNMFYCCNNFDCDLSNWDVSNVTNMSGMFNSCFVFTGKGLENWNVSNVIDMSYMFCDCEDFNCDLSKWNVSNVIDMSNLFIQIL